MSRNLKQLVTIVLHRTLKHIPANCHATINIAIVPFHKQMKTEAIYIKKIEGLE